MLHRRLRRLWRRISGYGVASQRRQARRVDFSWFLCVTPRSGSHALWWVLTSMIIRRLGFDPDSRSEGERGFTLIELMIVVVIIGILAAIGVPTYVNFVRNAETSEAVNMLGTAAKTIRAWVDEHPTIAANTIVAALQGRFIAVPDQQAPAHNLDVIPELQLRADAVWTYRIERIAFPDASRLPDLCLSARRNGRFDQGFVLYSSIPAADFQGDDDPVGWEGHFYSFSFVNRSLQQVQAGACTDAVATDYN